ncbi:type II toxin-antitoxin system VapC family toxin [Geoglobus sp.]
MREYRERIDENVRITSITAYELLRGAFYVKLKHGRDYELRQIESFLNEIEILPFTSKDSEISTRLWAELKEKGYDVNDADIMISAVAIREHERLLTLDSDFELIRHVSELDVDVVESAG